MSLARPGQPSKPSAQRQIIAFDADNFYVCCERLQDPSLVGRPVAVQQKNICATTSYEARAFGVDKLCLIKDAKKRCPDLIIVNGEDLTKYRQYSRRIFRLVKSIVWGNVEKLGMDELFVDVTSMIDSHIGDISGGVQGSTQTFFNLNQQRREGSDRGHGFYYATGETSGHKTPNAYMATDQDLRLSIASHLAAYIRDKVHSEIGFTTSAGVAHNKVLAKLLASKNKPAKQTTWLAGSDEMAVQDFMDPYNLSKVPGFGFRTLSVLRHKIFDAPLAPPGQWTDAPEHTHPYEYENGLERQAAYEQHRLSAHTGLLEIQEQALDKEQPMTVKIARDATTAKDLQTWFDASVGTRLWQLLQGTDNAPVLMAPEYPATVSVEDTYYGFKDDGAVNKAVLLLAVSLLNRLELEFVDEPALIAAEERSKEKKDVQPNQPEKRVFVRFATQIRLTTRFGRTNRTSKSAVFPTDAYDLTRDKQERANLLFKTAIQPMLLQATDKKDLGELRLLNIAAVNFVEEGPPPSVKNALTSTTSKRKRHAEADWTDLKKDAVDLAVLDELPADVREQVSRQLGITKPKARGQQSVQQFFAKKSRP